MLDTCREGIWCCLIFPCNPLLVVLHIIPEVEYYFMYRAGSGYYRAVNCASLTLKSW